MVSTSLSSRSSNLSSSSQTSLSYVTASPSSSTGQSASSSKLSLDQEDEENVTITRSLSKKSGKQRSQEDLRLLAVSTHMTELSYAISDIQTRIFEIQELRHKSQSSGDTTGTTNIIDQSLMSLDERLESVEKGMKSVNESLEPLLQTTSTPTFQHNGDPNQNTLILRKHATLMAEWEAVQDESDVLREELKEDKWLTVFRTVTDQADGMMSSLEKAVNRCQEFIWQVHRRGVDDPRHSQTSLSASRNDKPPVLTLEVFASLLDSFKAKKKHYMPATSKVLSIIDKGVRDRVTKNGETLRRHAESAQRWRNLRERISRTDTDMETVRKLLLSGDASPSENGSSTSGTLSTKNGYLATPPSGSRSSRAPSSASTLSRSISPFRKFARKITGTTRGAPPVTPLTVNKNSINRAPSSEPVPMLRRQKTSIFTSFRGSQPPTPITPERPAHKYSQSLTPDSSPRAPLPKVDVNTIKLRGANKQPWNSSTKVEAEERALTIKGTPPRRPPSAAGMYGQPGTLPPVPPIGRRSLSRASMGSSRPWSPITSSISTTQSSQQTHFPTFRPPSRAKTPSQAPNYGLTAGLATTPRSRPKTPSHIPMPSKQLQTTPSRSENSEDDDNAHLQRAFSPAFSTSGMSVTSSGFAHPPRPPSRSMIPVPSLHLSSPSRPSSSMSDYTHADTFRSSAARAQTPEHALRARVQQVPFFHGAGGRSAARPPLNKLPPSSFKDGSASRTPSRPGSRAGAYTPTMDNLPMYEYTPGNLKDPLDVEVAAVVNSIAHGLLIERVDPALRKIPKEGEEIKAQYAFSNALSRKVVTCRLTTLTRSGKTPGDTAKKVMCRVGGGWQDLSHYILNRQAGM
ncbi:hypothetical protein Hypma_012013 [Hypsizygus marmoreus]|uniref:GAR domain-containing protein n=1 Tax=Hypsizygus marmoreus TaxID=39966 RepID=A0A369JPY2_HYPMA|nr:hypothetical protein Hypma_012013 [Hypsizygus marmoreus]